MAQDVLDEGGEGYFASVSDLMVGILFIFLLMLTVFASNFRDAQDDQVVEQKKYEAALAEAIAARSQADQARAEALAERERALLAGVEASRQEELARKAQKESDRQKLLAEQQSQRNADLRELLNQAVTRLQAEVRERERARGRLLTSLEERLKREGVEVSIVPEAGLLRIPERLLFDTGASEPGEDAAGTLGVMAATLADILPCYVGLADAAACPDGAQGVLDTMLIEGHSDRQAYRGLSAEASRERNDRLSTDRALSIFRSLRQARPELDAMRNGQGLPLLAVSAYGERRPLPDALGDDAADYGRNRRIDLRFVLSSRTSDDLQALIDQLQPALVAQP